ncbi:hypothetical protein CBS101457_002954 [Exobasidium rhododendri]|nr:hypothetical protein CBS101457_002954 [Exobasidium rhododendri]
MKTLTPLHSDASRSDEEKGREMQAAFADVGPWLERHNDDVVGPKIARTVVALSQGSDKLAVLGFCWGGRQAILLANGQHSIRAIVANHPSYTEFPATFEAIQKPVLIQVGNDDSMFPFDQVKQVKDVLFGKKKDAKVVVYPGAVHGFSIRSDQNDKAEVQLKEEATLTAINFLTETLTG